MTHSNELGEHFEKEFEEFEKNRMYPPDHSGETMVTIDNRHIRAVARAVHFVRSGVTSQMSPQIQKSVLLDIKMLEEVYQYCLQQVREPGLPIPAKPIDVGEIGVSIGSTDKTPAD